MTVNWNTLDSSGASLATGNGIRVVDVVNRETSPFGRGMWIDGLDQLAPAPNNGRLLVRSDGSTARFAYSGGSYISPMGRWQQLVSDSTVTPNGFRLWHADNSYDIFDAAGKLVRNVDRNGNLRTYSYFASGSIQSFTDEDGLTTSFVYTSPNGVGKLYKMADWAGRETVYSINAASNGVLQSVTKPDPDAAGPLVAPSISFSYNATTGLLQSITEPGGRLTSFQYDAGRGVKLVTNSDGTTRQIKSGLSRLVVDLSTTGYSFATRASSTYLGLFANLATSEITDERGFIFRYVVDQWGLPVKYTNAKNETTEFVRYASGFITIVRRDPDGGGPLPARQTSFVVDAKGGRTQAIHPGGGTESWSYDGTFHQVTQHTDELGRVTKYTLDGKGNVTSVRRIVGQEDSVFNYHSDDHLTRMTYSTDGLLLSMTDPLGRITTYQYYATTPNSPQSRQLQTMTEAVGTSVARTTTYEYVLNATDKSVTTTITDGLGRKSKATEDGLGRITLMQEPNPTTPSQPTGPLWLYSYDGRDNPIQATDPLGRVTVYQYNTMNRLTQRTDPDPDGTGPLLSPATSYTYWGTGELKTESDPLSQVTDYTYDELGRLLTVKQPAPVGVSPRPEWTYTYDFYGNVESLRDPLNWITNYEYDTRDRLKKILEPSPNGVDPRPVTEFGYNLGSELTSVKDARLNTTIIAYDTLGRRTIEFKPDPDGAGPLTAPYTQFRYDRVGNLVGVIDPRGNLTEYEFDAHNRLVRTILPTTDPVATPFSAIIDDTAQPYWYTNFSHGYGGGHRKASSTNDPPYTWTVSGLTAGKSYEVLVTWEPATTWYPGWIIDGPSSFTVKSGSTTLATDVVDQRVPGKDFIDDASRPWERIALVQNAPGNTLTIELAAQYAAVADAVMVREIGAVESLAYDAEDQVLSMTNARGNVTSFQYDGLGRQTATIEPTGRTTTRSFDAVGNVTSIRYPWQSTSTHRNTLNVLDVNANGVVDPADANIVISHLSTGLPPTQPPYVDVNGNGVVDPADANLIVGQLGNPNAAWPLINVFRYDNLDRLTSTIEPLPAHLDFDGQLSPITTYSYDAASRVTAITDPMGRTVTYGYDKLNRPTSRTQPDPDGMGLLGIPVESITYDLVGNLISSTDPRNKTTTYGYDRLHRRTSVTDPTAGVTSFTYDAVGNQLTLRDALANVTTWSYDNLNRAISETNSLGKTRSFAYDGADNLLKVVDRRGLERRFTYDRWQRLTAEDWHPSAVGAATAGYRLSYDLQDNISSAFGTLAHASGPTYNYTYDTLDQMTVAEMTGLGFSSSRRLNYTYHSTGQVATMLATIGTTSDFENLYGYDRLGRSTSVLQRAASGSAVAPKRTFVSYNAAGQLTRVSNEIGPTLANPTGTPISYAEYTYNEAGWQTALTHKDPAANILANYSWTYDIAARMNKQTIANYPAESVDWFTYNDRDELTYVDRPGTANDEYLPVNATGNRTGANFVPASNNRYSQVRFGGLNYTPTYDDEGNLTGLSQIGSTNTIDYTYDHRNRLTLVQYKTGGTLTKSAEYTYDAFDRRVRKVVDPDGVGVQGAVTTKWVYDGQNPVLEFNGSNTLTHRYFYGTEVDQILQDERFTPVGSNWLPSSPGTVLLPLRDQVNTTRDLINTSGQLQNHIAYDTFGQVVSETAPAVDFLFGFGGFVRDEESGLNASDTRFYHPGLGRWTTEDPIGFAGGDVNLQRYVGNRPNMMVDPSGLASYWGSFFGELWNQGVQGVQSVGGAISDTVAGGYALVWYPEARAAFKQAWREQRVDPMAQRILDRSYAYGYTTHDAIHSASLWHSAAYELVPFVEQGPEAVYNVDIVGQRPLTPNEREQRAANALAGWTGVFAGAASRLSTRCPTPAPGMVDDFAGAPKSALRTSELWGNPKTLADHFRRHGPDFGATTADDDIQQGFRFFQRSQLENLPTKVDSKGVIRVYDPKMNTFGSFNPDGTIKTFYKPDPALHKYPTNLDYWNAQPGTAPWTP